MFHLIRCEILYRKDGGLEKLRPTLAKSVGLCTSDDGVAGKHFYVIIVANAFKMKVGILAKVLRFKYWLPKDGQGKE